MISIGLRCMTAELCFFTSKTAYYDTLIHITDTGPFPDRLVPR